MSDSRSQIETYLETLHGQRKLIAEAYHHGRVFLSEDTARGIRRLQQYRALVPYAQDEFRLKASLVRHLDEVFQHERLYAVGANLAELVARLPRLTDEYFIAYQDGRHEDSDRYAEDFRDAVFEIADSVDGDLMRLRVLTDNRFATVRTLAEKQRQNAFYVGRAEQMGEVLSALQRSGPLETLQGNSGYDPLLITFESQLQTRLPEWRASLLDITTLLKSFLYRLRQIEPTARRLRNFAVFLRRHPEYPPPDYDLDPEPPAWLNRAPKIPVTGHADLDDSTSAISLEKVAASIPPAKQRRLTRPEHGRLAPNTSATPESIEISLGLHQVAFRRYLAAARTHRALSALAWKRGEADLASIADEIWLHHVLYESSTEHPATDTVRFERLTAPPQSPLSGNIVIYDVVAHAETAGQ